MGSALTEIVRILQVRFTGAVYKSSGRAAIYIRLIGSLLFFVIFYVVYMALVTGNGLVTFVTTLSTFQTTIWYVPFVWAGTALYYLYQQPTTTGTSVRCFHSLIHRRPILFGSSSKPTLRTLRATSNQSTNKRSLHTKNRITRKIRVHIHRSSTNTKRHQDHSHDAEN